MKQNKSFTSFLSTWVARIISLLLAIMIFGSIKYLNMSSRVVRIPLEVELPESTSIKAESLVPTYIDIVLSGDDKLIYLVDPDSIKASADFSDVISAGIARVPVILDYSEDLYMETSLVITADPDVVRILFEEV